MRDGKTAMLFISSTYMREKRRRKVIASCTVFGIEVKVVVVVIVVVVTEKIAVLLEEDEEDEAAAPAAFSKMALKRSFVRSW